MSDVAVHCEALTKRYRIGERERYRTLRDAIANIVTRRKRNDEATIVRALDGVSFDVARGEIIGIIGRNGAGKSTLLRILSRVTKPTSGRAVIRGRVGALLEVGTGFHPELTGRENVFLNGAILGMSRREIAQRFDDIVAFAEVERFIDTPVKRYSSGMQLRLAFAVAAHLEPEIVFIDEVLAVGDAAFQKKCLGKMGDAARSGRTAIFVSHNLLAVQDLCSSAIWIDRGRIVAQGKASEVTARYAGAYADAETERTWSDHDAPGTETMRLRRVSVRPATGQRITVRTPFTIDFDYVRTSGGTCPPASFQLFNEFGLLVFESGRMGDPLKAGDEYPAGAMTDTCLVPGDVMNSGTYRIDFYFHDERGLVLRKVDDALTFEIDDSPELRSGWYGPWQGVVRPLVRWSTSLA